MRWDLWSGRASCSAGVELLGHEIVVFGMSQTWSGPLAIDHAVMQDAIDIEPVRAALARLGLSMAGQLSDAARSRLVAVLAKQRPVTMVGCAAIVTPCWTISTSPQPGMPAPSSAVHWQDWSVMRRFMCPAAPNTRDRMAAGRWR